MSKSTQPLVAIVIVNWNKKEMTGNCLKSLKMTSYKNYKVILIDNGSTDGSIEYLKKINPKMIILRLKRNYGYTEGTNVGWKYALKNLNAKYVCAMDNDIVTVQKDWLSLIVSELEKDPLRGIGSGKHTFQNGNLQLPYMGADRKDDNKPAKGKYEFVKEVSSFFGPAIVIKNTVIRKIGCYDENFFYGPNDIDYCLRAGKAGFKLVYNGHSLSVHIGSVSGLSPMKDFIYLNQSESMMIYSFRYYSSLGKIAMIFRQLGRALITRRAPIERITNNNLLFHWKSLPKRLGYFCISLVKALNNYSSIKSSSETSKILK